MSLLNLPVYRNTNFSPFSEQVPPGTYPGKIVSVSPGTKPVYQKPDEKEPAVIISIKFTGASGQPLTYEEALAPSAGVRAKLRKRVEAILPGRCTPETLEDDKKYLTLVQELEGQYVTLVVGMKASSKDPSRRYSNLEALLPLSNPPADVQEFKPGQDFESYPDKVDVTGTSLDEDDIPF